MKTTSNVLAANKTLLLLLIFADIPHLRKDQRRCTMHRCHLVDRASNFQHISLLYMYYRTMSFRHSWCMSFGFNRDGVEMHVSCTVNTGARMYAKHVQPILPMERICKIYQICIWRAMITPKYFGLLLFVVTKMFKFRFGDIIPQVGRILGFTQRQLVSR